jgi:hypothetical protein
MPSPSASPKLRRAIVALVVSAACSSGCFYSVADLRQGSTTGSGGSTSNGGGSTSSGGSTMGGGGSTSTGGGGGAACVDVIDVGPVTLSMTHPGTARRVAAGWDGVAFSVAWVAESNFQLDVITRAGASLGMTTANFDEGPPDPTRPLAFALSPSGWAFVDVSGDPFPATLHRQDGSSVLLGDVDAQNQVNLTAAPGGVLATFIKGGVLRALFVADSQATAGSPDNVGATDCCVRRRWAVAQGTSRDEVVYTRASSGTFETHAASLPAAGGAVTQGPIVHSAASSTDDAHAVTWATRAGTDFILGGVDWMVRLQQDGSSTPLPEHATFDGCNAASNGVDLVRYACTADSEGTSTGVTWRSIDPAAGLASPMFTQPGVNFDPLPGSMPAIVWDGQGFAVFWTESDAAMMSAAVVYMHVKPCAG